MSTVAVVLLYKPQFAGSVRLRYDIREWNSLF